MERMTIVRSARERSDGRKMSLAQFGILKELGCAGKFTRRSRSTAACSVLCTFRIMQYPKRISTVGPHEQECILPLINLRQFLLDVSRRLNFVPVHLENNVALLQSSVIGRAARPHLLDYNAVNTTRNLQLFAYIGSQIAEPQPPTHLALTFCGLCIVLA